MRTPHKYEDVHKSVTTGELLKSMPFNVLVHSFTDRLGS